MTNAAEENVISLLSQDDTLLWQLDLEPAADQYNHCRSLLFIHPFCAPLPTLVSRPSDLNVFAAPYIVAGHEMA
jgi:hypothetical protein